MTKAQHKDRRSVREMQLAFDLSLKDAKRALLTIKREEYAPSAKKLSRQIDYRLFKIGAGSKKQRRAVGADAEAVAA